MTSTYKIALLVAAVVCVLAIAFYAVSEDPEAAEPVEDVAAQPEPAPRATLLRDRTPPTPAPAIRPEPEPEPQPQVTQTPQPIQPSAEASPSGAADGAEPENDFLAELRARMAAARRPNAPSGETSAAANASASTSAGAASTAQPSTATSSASQPVASNAPATAPTQPPTTTFSRTTPPATATNTAAPRTTTTASASRTYTVVAGDTLSSIARKLYNSEGRWVEIAQANPTIDPIKLKVGQQLRLPDPTTFTNDDADAPAAPQNAVTYTVRPGDTLSSIARQYYNDPGRWRVIFNANRSEIGTNPNSLQAGARLVIPPAPNAAR